MEKKELLAPAGDYESLLQAVQNGADAVYFAGKKFGARTYASNFNMEEITEAIKYCHLYGVKAYVTINTIIYEEEITPCLDFIRFLHQNNVDAVILQDLGLIKIVREKFPHLEIHASTQMHNHNLEQIKMYEKMGIKRVILARELSLAEIKNFSTNLELEVFVHGALCICYSGQCLFSSLLMNRSGNRGCCAGICRLPFTLIENNQKINTQGAYLLSPKELCTLDNLKAILSSNIYSLKIEGRMKSPFYVGFITRLYRQMIDSYYESKNITISKEDQKYLQVLYNREFTKGYLFNESNADLMNIKYPNHQGIALGKVIEITPKKIKISLQEDLHQGDGIRFISENKGMIVNYLYNDKGLLINHANNQEIVYVDNKIGLKTKGKVLKTIDSVLEKNLKQLPDKKVGITCACIIRYGKKLSLAFADGVNTVVKYGNIIEKAKTTPTSKEIIKQKIASLGNTPFYLKQIEIELDDSVFVNMSEIKKLRREAINELISLRENSIPHPFLEKELIKKETLVTKAKNIALHVLVCNEEQIKVCLENKVASIYIENDELYQKYRHYPNVYHKLERVKKEFPMYPKEKLLISETGSLYKYSGQNDLVTDYSFNVANSYSVNFLERMQVKRITLSIEAKLKDIRSLATNIKNKSCLEVYLYGRPEVMIMKHCPLRMHINKDEVCQVCSNQNKYYLQDNYKRMYPLISSSKDHLTHIYYYESLNRLPDLAEYIKMGITNFRLEFFTESSEEIKSIFSKIKNVNIE